MTKKIKIKKNEKWQKSITDIEIKITLKFNKNI